MSHESKEGEDPQKDPEAQGDSGSFIDGLGCIRGGVRITAGSHVIGVMS